VSYELPLTLAALAIPLVYGTLEPNALVRAQGGTLLGVLPAWGAVVQPVAFVVFMAAAFAETNRLPFDLPEGESEIVGYHAEYSGMSFGLFFMAEYIHVVLASSLAATLFLGGWQVPWASTAVLRDHAGIVLAVLGGLLVLGGAGLGAAARRVHPQLGTARERGVLWTLALGLVAGGLALIGLGATAEFSSPAAATVAAVAQAACFGAKVMALGFFFIWVRWTLPRFRYDQVMRLGWKQLLPLALANLMATAGLMALGHAWSAR